jgi:alpha-tubulin suppressor-like RCC1 family protein
MGCEEIWLLEGDGPDARPTLNVSAPSTVVMVAAERARVVVDLTTNNSRGRALPSSATYAISLSTRYDRPGPAPVVASYSFDYSIATPSSPRLAELTIDTSGVIAPGVYEHELSYTDTYTGGFVLGPPALLRVVVLPTAGGVKTRRALRLAAGQAHTLVLLDDGTVWAWGDNQFGQLGDGTLIDRSAPVQVLGFDDRVRAIAAGTNHSIAVQEDGRVFTWGRNDHDELGDSHAMRPPFPGCPGGVDEIDGRNSSFMVPMEVIQQMVAGGCNRTYTLLDNVVDVAAGAHHSVALRADGSIATWGRNDHGQLGDNGQGGISAHMYEVVGLPASRAVAVAAAGDFSLAMLLDGRIIGWGDNGLAQLGAIPRRDILFNADVPFLSGAIAMSAGDGFVLARSAGTAGYRAWGTNGFGQLGNGTRNGTDMPLVINTHLSLTQLAAGGRHALAVLPSGQVYVWGDNGADQLAGVTAAPFSASPMDVPGLTGMSGLAAGFAHSLTRHNGCGSVWSWGRNLSGQLGQGDVSFSQAEPLPVYGVGEGDLGGGCGLGLRVWRVSGSGGRDESAACPMSSVRRAARATAPRRSPRGRSFRSTRCRMSAIAWSRGEGTAGALRQRYR